MRASAAAALSAAVMLASCQAPVGTGASTGSTATPPSAPGPSSSPAPGTARWRALREAPVDPRSRHIVAAAGSEVLVWGGVDDPGGDDPFSATGAAYDPGTAVWRRIADAPIDPRHDGLAVAMGREVLVLGGSAQTAAGDRQGAVYDPGADRWRRTAAPPSVTAPAAVAVWTGDAVLVWGQRLGTDPSEVPPVTARYDPAADEWAVLATAPVDGRFRPTGVWTGDELLVFGGSEPEPADPHVVGTATGAAYDPAGDTWRLLPPAPIPGRLAHSAVWTGDEMIVWGGSETDSAHDVLADGAAYDPAADSWRLLPEAPLAARADHHAAWVGGRMVVLGGQVRTSGSSWDPRLDTAAYLPSDDRWIPLGPLPAAANWWSTKAATVDGSVLYWGTTGDGTPTGAILRP